MKSCRVVQRNSKKNYSFYFFQLIPFLPFSIANRMFLNLEYIYFILGIINGKYSYLKMNQKVIKNY